MIAAPEIFPQAPEKLSYSKLAYLSLLISVDLMTEVISSSFAFVLFVKRGQNFELSAASIAIIFLDMCFDYRNGLAEAVGILCGAPYWQGDKPAFAREFVHNWLSTTLFSCASFALAVSADVFLALAGIEPRLRNAAILFVAAMVWYYILQNFLELTKSLFIMQRRKKLVWAICVIDLLVLLVGLYVFIYLYGMGLQGFALAYYIKSAVEAAIVFALLARVEVEWRRHFLDWAALGDFWPSFLSTAKISFSFFSESLLSEIASVCMVLTADRTNIETWAFSNSILAYMYFLANGFSGAARAICVQLISRRDTAKFWVVWNWVFSVGLCVFVCIGGAVVLFRQKIAGFLFPAHKEARQMESMLVAVGLTIVLEYFHNFMNSSLRVIRREELQFKMLFIVFLPCMLFFCVFFGFHLRMGNLGFILAIAASAAINGLVSMQLFIRESSKFFQKELPGFQPLPGESA